jgi:hypothetical protein
VEQTGVPWNNLLFHHLGKCSSVGCRQIQGLGILAGRRGVQNCLGWGS